jgi:hypothetical protein
MLTIAKCGPAFKLARSGEFVVMTCWAFLLVVFVLPQSSPLRASLITEVSSEYPPSPAIQADFELADVSDLPFSKEVTQLFFSGDASEPIPGAFGSVSPSQHSNTSSPDGISKRFIALLMPAALAWLSVERNGAWPIKSTFELLRPPRNDS